MSGVSMTLGSDRAELRAARRAIRALADAASEERADAVELVASEVLTNAILHGSPPVEIRASLSGAVLRVEVVDANPSGGVPQAPSASAQHGRGMAIVDITADRWGIERRDPGKAVWFEFDLHGPPAGGPAGREVCFERVPVAAYLRGQEQLDAMLHELQLLAVGDPDEFARLDQEVGFPVRAALDAYRGARDQGRVAAQAAASAGRDVVTLTAELPREAAEAAQTYAQFIGDLERLASDGRLLTGPPDEEVVRLRRWLAAEIQAQLRDGAPPTPFPG